MQMQQSGKCRGDAAERPKASSRSRSRLTLFLFLTPVNPRSLSLRAHPSPPPPQLLSPFLVPFLSLPSLPCLPTPQTMPAPRVCLLFPPHLSPYPFLTFY